MRLKSRSVPSAVVKWKEGLSGRAVEDTLLNCLTLRVFGKWGSTKRIVGFLCQECGFVELYRDVKKKKYKARESGRSLVR